MSGLWISIDGVEGAGKTTLVAELAKLLPDVVVVDEFMDEPVGRFLRETVKTHPHVYSRSLVGQSLVFLGEFWERFDLVIAPAAAKGATVVTDRGFLSKYAYQAAVMEPVLGSGATEALLTAVLGPMRRPDLSVVLTAPGEILRDRLIGRGEHCDKARQDFIEAAGAIFRSVDIGVGGRLDFDTSQTDREALAASVAERITELVESSSPADP